MHPSDIRGVYLKRRNLKYVEVLRDCETNQSNLAETHTQWEVCFTCPVVVIGNVLFVILYIFKQYTK